MALLLINAVMFLVELAVGWYAESTGLLADSLDMLADAGVYGLSLYAVGKGLQRQSSVAYISGLLQIVLGTGVLLEVLRRFLFGSQPESVLMMGVATLALVANISCLWILSGHRNAGVHMRASWIFSTNDLLANVGVILSGGLVWVFGSRYPDLAVGALISGVIVRAGFNIIKEAKQAKSCA